MEMNDTTLVFNIWGSLKDTQKSETLSLKKKKEKLFPPTRNTFFLHKISRMPTVDKISRREEDHSSKILKAPQRQRASMSGFMKKKKIEWDPDGKKTDKDTESSALWREPRLSRKSSSSQIFHQHLILSWWSRRDHIRSGNITRPDPPPPARGAHCSRSSLPSVRLWFTCTREPDQNLQPREGHVACGY